MRIKESEAGIQKAILQWGALQEGIQMFRMNVVGVPLPGGGFRPSPNRGIADIYVQLIVYGIPVGLWLEVKSSRGKMSKAQKVFSEKVGLYYVVRSIEDASASIYFARKFVCEKINLWRNQDDEEDRDIEWGDKPIIDDEEY